MAEELLINVSPTTRYLYKQEDIQNLVITTASAQDNTDVLVYNEQNGKQHIANMEGSFQNYLGNVLKIDRTEDPFKISASVNEIGVERRAFTTVVTAEATSYTAANTSDKLGLYTIAAPTKHTFKPIATRFELDADNVQKLCASFDGAISDDKVYYVNTTANNAPFFDYMNKDGICGLAGLSLLKSGGAVSKHKNIKIFKLNNGISMLLDGTIMCTITEAAPKFANEKRLCIKQQDPQTSKIYLEPVKMKLSKGFNPTFKQFAYDIVMDNGNEIYDVPESDLSIADMVQPEPVKQDVPITHF